MPFEPLNSDEPNSDPIKQVKDFESQLMSGCGTFLIVAVSVYLIGFLPNLFLTKTYRFDVLLTTLGIGAVLGLPFGIVASRKAGVPGAGGYIAGNLAWATFVFLRIEQVMISQGVKDLPQAEYPESIKWFALLGILALSLAVAAICVPRSEFEDKKPGSASR